MQIIPVFVHAKRLISVPPAVAGSACSLPCWAVSIGRLFLQQNYSFQLSASFQLWFQRSVPSLLKHVILEHVAVHLEEVEVSCSRQRNGYRTKPNLEQETTTLSSHRFLEQLFHPDLASDTGALGMLGEDPLGEIPVSRVILAMATQCSGSMFTIPWKRKKNKPKRQTKWTGSARRELRDVVHSPAPEGMLRRARVWEKTAYTDTEKISIKLRVVSSHSNFAVF